jgi:hypothetical protein
MTTQLSRAEVRLAHFVRGQYLDDATQVQQAGGGTQFLTPALDIDTLVWPRAGGFPAFDLSIAEIIDFLAACGRRLVDDPGGHIAGAVEALHAVNPVSGAMLRSHMNDAIRLFDRDLLAFEVSESLGSLGASDGWDLRTDSRGARFERRWFPCRSVHVLPGNTPHGGPLTIARTALTRGVALIKLPSNDPFTTIAVLRTMSEVDPDHPVLRSVNAVYWRGGDDQIESVLFRPQFFDKIIAWGGDSAIRSAAKYIGPGLELVSFDPKSSISLIGRESFATAQTTARAAELAAADVRYQEGCGTSRYQYVEGTTEQVDAYCAALLQALHAYHAKMGSDLVPTPSEIVAEAEGLRGIEPEYRVWGSYDGSGLIIRSPEPLEFYPDARTVNVVEVGDLLDSVQYINVATQTAGIYPPERKDGLRDLLAAGGVDRITDMGNSTGSANGGLGVPHDGMLALQRLVRWIFSHPVT